MEHFNWSHLTLTSKIEEILSKPELPWDLDSINMNQNLKLHHIFPLKEKLNFIPNYHLILSSIDNDQLGVLLEDIKQHNLLDMSCVMTDICDNPRVNIDTILRISQELGVSLNMIALGERVTNDEFIKHKNLEWILDSFSDNTNITIEMLNILNEVNVKYITLGDIQLPFINAKDDMRRYKGNLDWTKVSKNINMKEARRNINKYPWSLEGLSMNAGLVASDIELFNKYGINCTGSWDLNEMQKTMHMKELKKLPILFNPKYIVQNQSLNTNDIKSIGLENFNMKDLSRYVKAEFIIFNPNLPWIVKDGIDKNTNIKLENLKYINPSRYL
ncbi:hypothetical protein D3C87_1206590 [compost metagenome]